MIARDQQSEIPLEAFYMAKAVQKFVPHLSKELMVSEPCALVMLLSAVSQQSSAVLGFRCRMVPTSVERLREGRGMLEKVLRSGAKVSQRHESSPTRDSALERDAGRTVKLWDVWLVGSDVLG